MRIAEHFYSIQGEGVSAGVPAVFLRTAGCNLLCGGHGTIEDKALHDGAMWRCDTIEVWMKGTQYSEVELVKLFELQGYLDKLKQGAHLVITGGEPLQQQDAVINFIIAITDKLQFRPYIEIETNGTIAPRQLLLNLVKQWNVSPKLSSSGMPLERRIDHKALKLFGEEGARTKNAWCKVVIASEEDIKEIEGDTSPTHYFNDSQIILMPAASERETLRNLLPIVVEFCKSKGYRLSTRMQVEIWDKTTGV